MTRLEIEGWTLRTIEGIAAGAPHEDSRIECKSEWLDNTKKAARQLGAHANAAGGEPILWIIGLDRTRGVLGANDKELSNWWSSVQSEFNQLAPTLSADLIVPVGNRFVVALLFQTDRAPFVVNAQEGFLEVPWREGTRTNSARRSDLVRLLAPAVKLPDFEIMGAALRMTDQRADNVMRFRLDASLYIYIVPRTEVRVVFPFHRTHCSVQFENFQADLDDISFSVPVPQPASLTIRMSTSEMIVDGPGSFILRSSHFFDALPNLTDEARLVIESKPAGSDLAAVLAIAIPRSSKGDAAAKWGRELF